MLLIPVPFVSPKVSANASIRVRNCSLLCKVKSDSIFKTGISVCALIWAYSGP